MNHLRVIPGGRDDTWQTRGECNGVPQSVMFPERGESHKRALSYCAVCEVRTQCLDYAMDNNIKHGVWGGKSERQRRAIRRNRRLDGAA
jgi:WhiB family redox-sensing transcriptional regulator